MNLVEVSIRAEAVADIDVSPSGGDTLKSTDSSESFSGNVEFSSAGVEITGLADAVREFVSSRIASLSLGSLRRKMPKQVRK